MSGEPISIGIIGSGGYGRTARRYVRHTGEFDIVACMDVSAEAAETAAREDGATACTDLDALLDHDGLQAVSINTPVHLHAEHSRRALEAGKHVFITKPVAATTAEARDVLALAQSKGLAYTVGHHARHMPLARLEREMVLGGELGTVCNALFTCCSSAGLEQSAGDWRALPGKNPGGPLLQCGIHTLDQMLGTFGHAKRVCAMMQNSVTPHDVVDNTMTLFEFASGHQATFVCNYTTAYMHTHSYFGTRANLHVHSHITGLGQSQIYLQERARGPHELWRMLRIPDAGGYPDPHGGVLERDFARQIREGAPDYANARDAAAALAVLEAAVESHETGRAVEVAAV